MKQLVQKHKKIGFKGLPKEEKQLTCGLHSVEVGREYHHAGCFCLNYCTMAIKSIVLG